MLHMLKQKDLKNYDKICMCTHICIECRRECKLTWGHTRSHAYIDQPWHASWTALMISALVPVGILHALKAGVQVIRGLKPVVEG